METTYDQVMIKTHSTTQQSSLAIPENVKRDTYGEVVAIGPDSTLGLVIGDKILFEENEGKTVEVDGEKYVVLRQTYVMGRLVE